MFHSTNDMVYLPPPATIPFGASRQLQTASCIYSPTAVYHLVPPFLERFKKFWQSYGKNPLHCIMGWDSIGGVPDHTQPPLSMFIRPYLFIFPIRLWIVLLFFFIPRPYCTSPHGFQMHHTFIFAIL